MSFKNFRIFIVEPVTSTLISHDLGRTSIDWLNWNLSWWNVSVIFKIWFGNTTCEGLTPIISGSEMFFLASTWLLLGSVSNINMVLGQNRAVWNVSVKKKHYNIDPIIIYKRIKNNRYGYYNFFEILYAFDWFCYSNLIWS